MNKKLTLKLNKKVIDRAKKYAQKNKQSLSAIVENYFKMISASEKNDEIEISPNVLELSGVIKLPENTSLDEVYGQHLEEKYNS